MFREPLVFVPGMMADARMFLPHMVRLGSRWAVQVTCRCGVLRWRR